MVHGKEITVKTTGYSDMKNITDDVARVVAESGLTSGIVTVTVIGSTASVSTIEYEPALVADFKDHLEHCIAASKPTRHGSTWGDDNGFSHIRATLMGPGITIPFTDKKPVLGTWQQIVVIDHDNRPRTRKIFVQVMGE